MKGTTTTLLLLAGAAAGEIVCSDPYDSGQLSEAFDAALMELLSVPGWFLHLQPWLGT